MLTDEQAALAQAIANAVPVSGRACAGTGKTTTAVAGLRDVTTRTLALAFNKTAAEALKHRINNPNVESKTLNALGHGIVSKFINKKLELDTNKTRAAIRMIDDRLSQDQFIEVQSLITAARIAGLVPSETTYLRGLQEDTLENWEDLGEEPSATSISIARAALALMNRQVLAGLVDFDDQIYVSALNQNLILGYDQLVVDEAQDLNALQHRMLQKFKGAKLAIIGDPRQSIYGFRGAVSSSMEKLEQRFSLETSPLTLCFRCDRNIVLEAQQWCPEIRAASEADGLVDDQEQWDAQELDPTHAILCRNNAPLLAIAFRLLRSGIRVNFVGRDIGKNLTQTIKKALGGKAKDIPELSLENTIGRLNAYFDHQLAVANARENDAKAEQLLDRRECIFAIIENAQSQNSIGLMREIAAFFAIPGDSITLSSIHRAKGQEWDRVYWLDSHLGARRGQTEEQQLQEQNLKYVAATRAKHHLTYIQSAEKD